MLGVRFSLFSRIMLWFFLNLVILGAVLIFVFNSEIRFSPRFSTNRLESISRLLTEETQDRTPEERGEILKRYSDAYGVEFFLFGENGRELGGRDITLPPEVEKAMAGIRLPGPFLVRREATEGATPTGGFLPPGRPPSPFFYAHSSDPPLYWSGSPIFIFEKGKQEPTRGRLVAASASMSGNGLFFDPWPWIMLALVIFGGSTLFWLPFVRNITHAVRALTSATEKIAEEQFDARVSEKRTDEIGRLGRAVNHLAARLSGYVTGQKRFLGDISHELNTPLARMQFALGILEERVSDENQPYVQDVKEEVELMTRLVAELLSYSKAGIQAPHVRLESVNLRSLLEQVVARETANETAELTLNVDDSLTVLCQPDLLSRAAGNVIRNAVRYAAGAGEIVISAQKNGEGDVHLTIADHGAGVPEHEIGKLFDPFYRIESDRARQSGGSGLGMAIVKTCVEACGGKVSARNLSPQGFEVSMLLRS
jgi:two-component system sensor histidine kinase CpxA